jgi:hypothetical protein
MITLILCFVFLFRKLRAWLSAKEASCAAAA